MTIPYCIQIGDSDLNIAQITSIISETFTEIDQIYNNWNPHSEVSFLNQLPTHHKITLSSELASFLKTIDQFVTETEGRFDPTVGSLSSLWKEALKQGTTPDPVTLATYVPSVGWHHIHLEGNTFWKDHPLTALDFGGVAKGYGVDLIVERLQQHGYRHIYVEWGGEIRTLGSHPQGRPWQIGIIGLSSIALHDEAIATSGSYIQSWTVNGISFTHIIDPHTCEPLRCLSITSTSVLAPTCCYADALATSFMLFPSPQDAHTWASLHNISLFLW